jgi:hypothetical protein
MLTQIRPAGDQEQSPTNWEVKHRHYLAEVSPRPRLTAEAVRFCFRLSVKLRQADGAIEG